jgi:hypothetical protein
MKQLLRILTIVFALNFLTVTAAIAILAANGKLDRARIAAAREALFPPPATQPAATQPAGDSTTATTRPLMRLEQLLDKRVGRTASEQVEFIQHSFDQQMAILDRRQRELEALQDQIEAARDRLTKDRETLQAQRKALEEEKTATLAQFSDKGFQDALALYQAMPAKQVKTIFMTLDEDIVKRFLEAMQPRTASKIIKEFKAPDETDRIQKILEKMRQPQLGAQTSTSNQN